MILRKCSYLRCPICKSKVNLASKSRNLKCLLCKKDYQVKNGIPIMLKRTRIQGPSQSQIFYENFNKILNQKNFEVYFNRRWSKVIKYTNILKLPASGKFLEIGSGEGKTIEAIGKRIKTEIIGLDYSFKLCHSSKRKLGNKVKIINGDICSLPFSDKYFDFVYCNAVLHHVKKQNLAVFESIRVCKSGGYLVFVEPNRFHPIQALYGILQKSERGVLKFKYKNIVRYLNSTKRIKSIKILPLNTFIFSYRKFPPECLFLAIKKIEPIFDKKFLSTHFMIIALIKK